MEGESLRSICKDERMPSHFTVFGLLQSDTEFSARYARAREFQGDTMDDKVLETADNLSGSDTAAVTPEMIQAARVQIDAYKWRAAHLRPSRYGAKQQIAHTGLSPDPSALAAEILERLHALEKHPDALRQVVDGMTAEQAADLLRIEEAREKK
jgi:hypothetical protein